MMEEKVREAIVPELERQSESDPSKLRLELNGDRLTAKRRYRPAGARHGDRRRRVEAMREEHR
ncbi:MAG: hypothetical protein EOR71_28295 [Mesorhizobium sp.]|nr:MAG: hypothetical protein EOR71_28295 [Mesorhizobium sp.]